MVEATTKLSPAKPPTQSVAGPEEGDPPAVATATDVPLCLSNVSHVASGGRRCSLRLESKRNLQDDERGTSDVTMERRGKKKRRLDGGNEELLIQPPAQNTGNDVEGDEDGAEHTDACTDAHFLVVKTLRKFNKHYLHFVQGEEQRVNGMSNAEQIRMKNRHKGSKKSKASKSKGEEQRVNGMSNAEQIRMKNRHKGSKKSKASKSKVSEDKQITKRGSKRPDLKAISKMLEEQTVLYPNKIIGHLPGVDVGRHFFSRAEMVVVGLHSHWLNGIDYMGKSYSKLAEYIHYSFPLAICIVLSGMYEDDLDNSDDVIYTGQGGHDLLGNKRQVNDQKMERGNLALKNSMLHHVPVRVVRGHGSASSYCGKVYTYDGLYEVAKCWAEKGVSGFTVFKYRLRRLEGQPALTTNQVQFIRPQVPRAISEIRGLVCEDIAGGQENFPIPATNTVDEPPFPPTGYVYSKSIQVASCLKLPPNAEGCECKGNCINSGICACAKLNGSDFPYVGKDGGRLIEPKAIVFECGPNCGCDPGCVNRTSQQGFKYRLEVFRTPKKGWAVRSWDTIPAGAPICEYTGILTKTDDIDSVSENNFIFEIDCLQTMEGLDGREKRLGDVALLMNVDEEKLENPEFCIDAGRVGNVARFINHSCQPNLFVQCVLSSHHDIKLARVLLFAADTIPPLQELTYDYGYALNSVIGPDGKIKQMPCHCGAVVCRGRLY